MLLLSPASNPLLYFAPYAPLRYTPTMTIDTILFDLDGTLVQHNHVLLPDRLAEWGYPRPAQAVDEAFTVEIQWFYEYASTIKGTARDNAQTWQEVLPMLYWRVAERLDIDDDTVVGHMIHFFAAEPTPPLFEDTLPLLEKLVDGPWQLGIITQRGRTGVTRFLRDHALLERFGVIVAGDDGFGRKPAPDPFHYALARLNGDANRAIFVGDHIADDCGGACGAGLRAFLIDRQGLYVETPADATAVSYTRIETLLDLLDHLSSHCTEGVNVRG